MSGSIEWSEFTDYCIANATTSANKESKLLVPDLTVREQAQQAQSLTPTSLSILTLLMWQSVAARPIVCCCLVQYDVAQSCIADTVGRVGDIRGLTLLARPFHRAVAVLELHLPRLRLFNLDNFSLLIDLDLTQGRLVPMEGGVVRPFHPTAVAVSEVTIAGRLQYSLLVALSDATITRWSIVLPTAIREMQLVFLEEVCSVDVLVSSYSPM